MHLQEFSNATTFLDRTGGLLFEEEFANNLLLSSALALSKNGVTRLPSLSFFTVFRDDVPVASMLRSPNRRLILSTADETSADYLGREVSKQGLRLRGVFAPEAVATKFMEAYSTTSECTRHGQDLMVLERLSPIEAADGLFRTARAKDLTRLVSWSHAFADECGLDETRSETEEVVRKYLENRQLFVWDVGGKPVAMAAAGGITPRAARVSMVYTDPAHRNRGYALTLVHRLSHRLFREGREACVLFVDSENPVSRRVYEKIGYEARVRFADYRFTGSCVTGSRVTTTG